MRTLLVIGCIVLTLVPGCRRRGPRPEAPARDKATVANDAQAPTTAPEPAPAAAARTGSDNPAPRRALNAYSQFTLAPVQASPAAQRATAGLATIQEQIRVQLEPLLKSWGTAGDGPTLRIEPYVSELRFVSRTARVWAGALAGNSAVVMRLRLVDEKSGEVVGEPEFFQRANAMGGAWTFGGSDKDMLARIVTVAREYLSRNYSQAVGGPAGLERSQR